jgi:hypothetical protein
MLGSEPAGPGPDRGRGTQEWLTVTANLTH